MVNRQLWQQWRAQEEFMREQSRNLALAQKAIVDLQSTHAEIENERARAEQEKRDLLQKLAKMEEDRQAKEVELKKEIEGIKVLCVVEIRIVCVDLLYRRRRIGKWLHWCSVKGEVQNFDPPLQKRRYRRLVSVSCIMFSVEHRWVARMPTSSIRLELAVNSKIPQWLVLHRQTRTILNPWTTRRGLHLTLRRHRAQESRPT